MDNKKPCNGSQGVPGIDLAPFNKQLNNNTVPQRNRHVQFNIEPPAYTPPVVHQHPQLVQPSGSRGPVQQPLQQQPPQPPPPPPLIHYHQQRNIDITANSNNNSNTTATTCNNNTNISSGTTLSNASISRKQWQVSPKILHLVEHKKRHNEPTSNSQLQLQMKVYSEKGPSKDRRNAVQGWLNKQGCDGLKMWRKRWFVLSNFCLYYFKGITTSY